MSRVSSARKLRIEPRSVPAGAYPAGQALAVSEDGHGVVHGWFDPPRGEVLVRQLATFRFASGSDEVIAYTDELDAGGEHVVHSFYSTVLPLIAWACDGVEVFHSSAVRSARGVVALSGPSESGKTTLAYGLASRGYERFAEDAVAFRAAPFAGRGTAPFHDQSPGSVDRPLRRLRPDGAVGRRGSQR